MNPKPASAYTPCPVDTSAVELSEDLLALSEQLAQNTHDQWAVQRIADGWRWGPMRDDIRKEHPLLIPYEALSESEKEYDRITSRETIKVLLSLGYRITKQEDNKP